MGVQVTPFYLFFLLSKASPIAIPTHSPSANWSNNIPSTSPIPQFVTTFSQHDNTY